MTYHRTDIVRHALGVLDQYGLADLSMRRLAGELGIQPSALYHHFANKQALLAAVADEVLERGVRAEPDGTSWDEQVIALSGELRNAMLAYRDGAELVATAHAFGLGASSPASRLASAIRRGGCDAAFADAAAATVLYFVFGHVSDEQMHLQASSAGAIDAPLSESAESFDLGLSLILDGIRHHDRLTAPSLD